MTAPNEIFPDPYYVNTTNAPAAPSSSYVTTATAGIQHAPVVNQYGQEPSLRPAVNVTPALAPAIG